MRWLKLTLAYDGTAYAGWQFQPEKRTVQQTIEDIYYKITGERLRVIASGRTDAGVHALGQVVSLKTQTHLPVDILCRALNAELPLDIAVHSVEEMPGPFHAIRDAVRKRYRYQIVEGPLRDVFRRHYAWFHHTPLDVVAMQRAAWALVGKHDFASFQSSGAKRTTTVRTVFELSVRREPAPNQHVITLEIEADGFLYNMVRAIVGTLVEVGRGTVAESWPAEVLAACDRRRAGRTAPANGLVLVSVDY